MFVILKGRYREEDGEKEREKERSIYLVDICINNHHHTLCIPASTTDNKCAHIQVDMRGCFSTCELCGRRTHKQRRFRQQGAAEVRK